MITTEYLLKLNNILQLWLSEFAKINKKFLNKNSTSNEN